MPRSESHSTSASEFKCPEWSTGARAASKLANLGSCEPSAFVASVRGPARTPRSMAGLDIQGRCGQVVVFIGACRVEGYEQSTQRGVDRRIAMPRIGGRTFTEIATRSASIEASLAPRHGLGTRTRRRASRNRVGEVPVGPSPACEHLLDLGQQRGAVRTHRHRWVLHV